MITSRLVVLRPRAIVGRILGGQNEIIECYNLSYCNSKTIEDGDLGGAIDAVGP